MNTAPHSPLLKTYDQIPVEVASGQGVWIFDTGGRKYLDLYGGHAVSLLGHSPTAVTEAIYKQAKTLFFYSNVVPLKIREEAAQALAEFGPNGFGNIFFCNSGGEANENALKMALRLTGREEFISFKGAFHGRTLLANAVTDTPSNASLGGWVGERVTFLTPNNKEELSRITSSTAAVILEPIQSIGGVIEFSTEFLKALRARCSECGALLIFDEVQTGMGRVGVPFISGFSGIAPDMFTTAKGLATGFPVGALFVSDDIAKEVKVGDLGSTFGGGPLAMAAVLATVKSIINEKLIEKADQFGAYAHKILAQSGNVEVRGRGCLLGLKLNIKSSEMVSALLEQGIITGGSKDPFVLRLLPPIIAGTEHIDLLQQAMFKVFGKAV